MSKPVTQQPLTGQPMQPGMQQQQPYYGPPQGQPGVVNVFSSSPA